ncbi:MAG: cytochrome b/b6 domain-containing protein [Nitrospirota bacterium]
MSHTLHRIDLHPLPVRVWHWINAASFIVLIATGMQLRYKDIFSLMSFRTAVDIHNIFGFILTGNLVIWFAYYLATGKIRIYLPTLNLVKLVKEMVVQARYYGYGIFVGDENPHHPTPDNKFNAMQKTLYLAIMVLLIPLQVVTGVLLWDVKRFEKWISLAGGLRLVDSVHVFLFLFFTAFIFVHVYLATLGHTPLAHIKAMFTGYEEAEKEHAH